MIECDPTANDDVLKVAVPLVSETLPKDVVPSMKVTLPVGMPAPGEAAETVAVKVTDCPNTEGFAAAVTLRRGGGLIDDLRQGRTGGAAAEIRIAAVNGRDAVGTDAPATTC